MISKQKLKIEQMYIKCQQILIKKLNLKNTITKTLTFKSKVKFTNIGKSMQNNKNNYLKFNKIINNNRFNKSTPM